jgi:hypothetical protein
MLINKEVTLYDVEVEIDLSAYDIAEEFSSTTDTQELLSELAAQNNTAVRDWVIESADELDLPTQKRQLSDYEKDRLRGAILLITAVGDYARATATLTGSPLTVDYNAILRVLTNLKNEGEAIEAGLSNE